MSKQAPHQTTTGADRAIAAWMTMAAQHPWRCLAVLVVLMGCAALGALRLGIDADSSRMISPDLPFQQRALALNAAFPQLKSNIIITVRAVQPDAADAAAQWITRDLRARDNWIEGAFSTVEDPFLAAHGFMYRSLDSLDTAFSRLSKSSNLIAHLRQEQTVEGFAVALADATALSERAEIDPDSLDRLYDETAAVFESYDAGGNRAFSWTSVLDKDAPVGSVIRVISVVPRLDLKRLSPAKPALATIATSIAALPMTLSAGVQIGVTGEPALRAEERQSVLSTIGLSLTISMVLVGLLLWVGLGSWRQAVLALGSLVVSLVLTTGFAGMAFGELNLISIAFVVLMVGLGIDFAIHILAHLTELHCTGAPPERAIRTAGHRAGLALALGAATTALAFLGFGFTDFDGMSQLGLLGSAGVLIAFAVSITIIPAFSALAPHITASRRKAHHPSAAKPASDFWPAALIVIGVLALWPASFVRFDPDPMALRNPDTPSVKAFRALAADPLTTPYRASLLVRTGQDGEQQAEQLRLIKGIANVLTIQSLIPAEQDAKLALLDIVAPSLDHALFGTPTELVARSAEPGTMLDQLTARLDPTDEAGGRLFRALKAYSAERSAQSDEQVARRLYRFFPMMLDRLEAMLSADMITEDTLPADLLARFVSDDGHYRIEVIPEADLSSASAVRRFAEQITQHSPEVTGGPIQLDGAGRVVSHAMIAATLFAAFATAVLAWIATRRLSDVAAILLPLVLAGILTAAASVLLDIPFNYANVIVLPLLIGIGVDSGIHIAVRERRAPGAVFATSTPRAVLVSALTTMAAFGTLALSDHRGTASMGALLAIAMLMALISIFALTPWILRHFHIR